MKRWLALVVIAAMLAVPVASAGWSQAGGDAATTGRLAGGGPATNATALRVQLPGQVSDGPLWGSPAEPLIVDGAVYVPVEPDGDSGSSQGIARVDLDTAEVELIAEMDQAPQHAAVAEGRIVVTHPGGLSAYDLETGEPVWSADRPRSHGCYSPSIQDSVVLAPCFEDNETSNEPRCIPTGSCVGAARRSGVVLALDFDTGEELWVTDEPFLPPSEADSPGDDPSYADGAPSIVLGISTTASQIFAVSVQSGSAPSFCEVNAGAAKGCYRDRETTFTLWSLNPENGDVVWSKTTEPIAASSTRAEGTQVDEERARYPPFADRPTATGRLVYAKLNGTLEAINPSGGEANTVWSEPLGQEDDQVRQECGYRSFGVLCWIGASTASAVSGDALYAASTQSIYRFDTEDHTGVWRSTVSLDEQIASGSLAASDDAVYAMARDDVDTTLYALDTEDGDQRWTYDLPPVNGSSGGAGDAGGFAQDGGAYTAYSYAADDGVLVVAGLDASLRVIGRTDASLIPDTEVSTTSPGAGQNVTVDLSGSEAGAQGPATRYKAVWGDGNTTGWTTDSSLSHAYASEDEHTARFWVANEANQTAVTTQTFDVGATEPNWIEERFKKDNQDMTFGILGVALALGGGAIGVASRQRKRSRLRDELEAIEQAYEDTKDRPLECEAQLTERKTHARGLVLDGELDEEQFGVIEQRVEELLQGLRVNAMEDEFDFLPHVLVKRAREMLADGTVSSLEREAFVQAVEEDDVLTEEQKAKVRERIEAWHVRDAGGGSR